MTAKRFTFEIKTQGNKAYTQWYDNRKSINSAETLCGLLNELHEENKELQDTIETICKDFEESHGMDIRNADWFTAW